MKRLVPIVLWALVALLAACTPKKQVPELEVAEQSRSVEGLSEALSAIDSLMWQRPDSALTLLLPWFDDCRDVACNVYTENDNGNSEDVARYVSADAEYDRHYANLLLSELLYKNDSAQTNRQELLQAVAYFDSLSAGTRGASLQGFCRRDTPRVSANRPSIAFLSARAHYMNGVGYYENDSVVEACQEYMKALDIMQDHFEEKELVEHKAQFMALVYTRLTDLFSRLYLHEQTVYFSRQSLSYYKKQNVPIWYLSLMLCEIGAQYDMLEQLDSADIYYQKAVSLLNDTNCLLYKDLAARQSFLSYKKRNTTENSLKQLYKLIGLANSEMEYLSRCLTIGGVFYYEKRYDSAFLYLDKVFQETTNDASKKQAAEWLVEICKIEGRGEQAFEYAEYLAPFANQEENQSAIKSQLTELYKNYSQNNLEQIHKHEKKKSQKWAVAIVGGLLTLILILILFLHKNKKRKKHLEVQIKEEQYTHDVQQKALSGRLKKSNETLREALKQIEKHEDRLENNKHSQEACIGREQYAAFIEAPICQEILGRVDQLHSDKRTAIKTDSDISEYKAFALSATQLVVLSKTVDEFFPCLYPSLKKKHPDINQKDWRFCLLYLLQLDKMSISVMLQESYHTCRRYTLKLERVFQCKHGLTDFLLEEAKAL